MLIDGQTAFSGYVGTGDKSPAALMEVSGRGVREIADNMDRRVGAFDPKFRLRHDSLFKETLGSRISTSPLFAVDYRRGFWIPGTLNASLLRSGWLPRPTWAKLTQCRDYPVVALYIGEDLDFLINLLTGY